MKHMKYFSGINSVCHLIGYSDADYGNDVNVRKSTFSFMFKTQQLSNYLM